MYKRFLFLSSFLVILVGIIISVFFVYQAKNIAQSEIERRGAILAKAVAKGALQAMQSGQGSKAFEGVIKSLHADPDVEIAMVIDTAGRILAHSDERSVANLLYLDQWENEVLKSAEPKIKFDSKKNRYLIGLALQGPRSFRQGDVETSLPTENSAIIVGAIFLGISQERMAQRTKATLEKVFYSLAGLVLFALLFSALMTREIVKPLKALTRATFQISQGNLQTQVDIRSADELGLLAKSFNTMTKKLRETTVSKRELEAVVEQKTKALKEANETLLEANVHLKNLRETESRFVSMASHELRTPMTSIQGFISLMLKYYEKLTKEQMLNYCKAVADESNRLSRMINEVLDLKRIEQGRIEIHAKKTDIRALAQKVVEELQIRPNQPRYQVSFDDGELIAFVDEDKVKQIFINLLSNSAKYTPTDKTVTIEGFEVGGKTIVINVRDEGPGIPKELWEKLFHPFARANDAVSRKTVGSGLGLAITKSLVETMGGRVRAENLKTGAQFTVVLPKGKEPNANGN